MKYVKILIKLIIHIQTSVATTEQQKLLQITLSDTYILTSNARKYLNIYKCLQLLVRSLLVRNGHPFGMPYYQPPHYQSGHCLFKMAIPLVRQTVSPHTIRQASVFYRMAICLVRQTIIPQTIRQANVFYRMAIRLVRQTINRHTIRQASVFTEQPSVWYARLLAPTLFVRPLFAQNGHPFGTPNFLNKQSWGQVQNEHIILRLVSLSICL